MARICRPWRDYFVPLHTEMKKVAVRNARSEAQKREIKDLSRNNLLSWGLLAEDEKGEIHPTNGYVYLTGGDPLLSMIQCGMFKGTTRAVFVDKREYTGTLWKQIDEAHHFVLRIFILAQEFAESTGRTSMSFRLTASEKLLSMPS